MLFDYINLKKQIEKIHFYHKIHYFYEYKEMTQNNDSIWSND